MRSRRTFLRLGPAVTVAAVAAVVGFLALRTSNVPMVRDFGVLLSIGTAAVVRRRAPPAAGRARVARPARRQLDRARRRARGGSSGRRTCATGGARPPGRRSSSSRSWSWSLGPWRWDARRWNPIPSVGSRRTARSCTTSGHCGRVAGSSAELGLMVETRDVLRPDVLRWMSDFEARAVRTLRRPARELHQRRVDHVAGHRADTDHERCPRRARGRARSHPALVHQQRPHARRRSSSPSGRSRSTNASSSSRRLVARSARHLRVSWSRPSGLAVVGTEAVTSLTANREQMSYLALAAVFVWLLLALRSVRRAAARPAPGLTALALELRRHLPVRHQRERARGDLGTAGDRARAPSSRC